MSGFYIAWAVVVFLGGMVNLSKAAEDSNASFVGALIGASVTLTLMIIGAVLL